MTDTKPTPAVIYAAKSTEDKRGSIGTQIEDCRALAAREGWEVVGVFQDESKSADKGNRGDDLARAREHAQKVGGVIVVQHSDRLARGDGIRADHLVELVLWARNSGVRWASVQDPQTFDGMGLVYAAMMGDRNHEDSARKSAATQDGLRRRKESGKPVGPLPLGFTVDKNIVNAPRVLDPVTVPLVERIFSLVERGATYGDVARILNAEGIRTRPRGKAKTGCVWSNQSVREIVLNPAYAGEKGYPELIDPDRWHAIVGRLKTMGRTAAKRRQGGRRHVDAAYFLRGIAFCGKCGASLYTRKQALGAKLPKEPGQRRASREQVRAYVCRNRRESTSLCDAPAIPAALFEDHVLRHLKCFVGAAEEWLNQQAALRDGEHQARRDALDTQLAGLAALDEERDRHFMAYRAMIAEGDTLARYALEEVGRIDAERATQEKVIADTEAVISEWAGPPDVEVAMSFYRDLLDVVHGRIEHAVGPREMNQALSTVVGGLWAEIEVDRERLLVEFELLHPGKQVLPGGAPVMLPTRPSLPPRRLNDLTEQPPAFTFEYDQPVIAWISL